jgi:eukaryotic-like serine/threonine-protein kinase
VYLLVESLSTCSITAAPAGSVREVFRVAIMSQSKRAFAGVLLGSVFAGFSWSFPSLRGLLADDQPKATRPVPSASPPRADGESPAVTLFRGGPERTGSVSGTHLPEHPALRWTARLAGFPGDPLLADGVIYVGDFKGTLYAIKAVDGKVLWQFQGTDQIYTTPARRGEAIYFTSRKGLTALSRRDGTVLWNCGLVGMATESSPLIVADRIIVGGYSGKIFAVDFDGKLIWQYDIADDAPPAPPGFDANRARPAGEAARPRTAASDGTAVFQPVFDQSRIIVIDLKAGRRRWSFQAKGWMYGEPTVTDERVFFGSQDNRLYCLDKRRKTLFWTFPTKSRIEAGVAYRDGSVYFGSCDGRFFRVNAETGKEIWRYETPRSPGVITAIYSAPLCTEDAVYFGSFDGYLYGLKRDTGELKWRIRPVEGSHITSSPVTDGRRIFLAIQRNAKKQGDHAIVAIGERE